MWRPFDNGQTIGKLGSEGGVTVRDQEHDGGSRITLERDCGTAPWSVTCGIYGWFFHTRFLGSEADAEFPTMLAGLAAILDMVPREEDPNAKAKMPMVYEAIDAFVSRFP